MKFWQSNVLRRNDSFVDRTYTYTPSRDTRLIVRGDFQKDTHENVP